MYIYYCVQNDDTYLHCVYVLVISLLNREMFENQEPDMRTVREQGGVDKVVAHCDGQDPDRKFVS